MKKFIASLFLFAAITIGSAISLTSCGDSPQYTTHQHSIGKQEVTCYHHTDDSGALIWYYLLFCNGRSYYYTSPTYTSNFNSVSWSETNPGINSSWTSDNTQYVDNGNFSQEFQESNGFEQSVDNNSSEEGQESQGFESSDQNSESGSSDNGGGTESGGFEGGGDSGGSDGGGGE